jgi:hypothetical protein
MTAEDYRKIITPYSTSEMNAMCEAARHHFHDLHDRLFVVGAELYVGLSKLDGRTGMFGLDTKLAARRVVKNFVHAGALNLEAAKAVRRAYTTYQQLYVVGAGEKRRGFQVDK